MITELLELLAIKKPPQWMFGKGGGKRTGTTINHRKNFGTFSPVRPFSGKYFRSKP